MRYARNLIVAGLVVTGRAHAGNDDSFALGNDAALTGGSIAATTHGPDAVYYNPAGMAGATQSSLDMTASAFVLRQRSIPKASVLLLPGARTVQRDLNSQRLLIVPTSLALTRKVDSNWSWGAGIFVPRLDAYSFDQDVATFEDDSTGRLSHQADIRGSEAQYDAGVAVAWAVTPHYRLGAALFGSYETFDQVARFWWELAPAGEPPLRGILLGEERLSLVRTAAGATIALQADATPELHLALVLKSPRMMVTQDASGDSITVGGIVRAAQDGPDQGPLLFDYQDLSQRSPKPPPLSSISPPRANLAVALDHGSATVSGEVDLSPALTNLATGLNARTTVNGRLGLRVRASEGMTWGLGLYSDRSRFATSSGFPGFRVDYYGCALGATLSRALSLDEQGLDAILFNTTIGIRSAVGFGEASSITFDFRNVAEGEFDVNASTPKSVVFYETALHVGTGIFF